MSVRKSQSNLFFKRNALAFTISVISPLLWAENLREPLIWERPPGAIGDNLHSEKAQPLPVVINGIPYTVDASHAPASYSVINGGKLDVVGGAVVESLSTHNSNINVTDSSVKAGITVLSGDVTITGTTVQNLNERGIILYASTNNLLVPSTAHITDSSVSGLSYGAAVGPTGEIWIANSSVFSDGYTSTELGNGGIKLSGGVVHVSDRSQITGVESGIYIIGPTVTSTGDELPISLRNIVEIDNSTVTAMEGSAILVSKLPGNIDKPTTAHILISNGSVLKAGNGRLVDVENDGTANVEVNNSQLDGDMIARDQGTLNVVLRNHASLNGEIINANSVTIDSSGQWQFAADNTVKSLAIDGGNVSFTGDAFHTLNLGALSGRGTFDMRINLDTAQSDLLNVNGQAFGHHQLNVQNTGVEAVPETFDALRIVHTEGGDAEFGLVGGKADLGVYSYGLERQGDDWFVVSAGKVISPSTQSALALFNVGPSIWNSELTTLRSRMGEIRGQEQGGGWIRAYGNRFNASLDSGLDYRQKQQGMSFGADAPVPVGAGQLSVGLMGGFSKSDLDMSRGTSGQVNSYYIGGYGTWLSDEGYYVDAALKLNKFHNESKVAMSDGARAKGNYTNGAVGGTLEVGKHIKLSDDYFVEPYAQLSSVWIAGDRYTLDNGLEAKTGRTRSVLGKLGTTAGRNFTLEDGSVLQPYVRVAMAQEFARSNDVEVNDTRFDNSLFGSRTELGAGVSVALSKRLELHADFDYMKGKHVEQPWGANVGLKVAF